MPWCPKCKNEYKEGYTTCADCGTELVDSLMTDSVVVSVGSQEELNKMSTFLLANGMKDCKVIYEESQDVYQLLVDPQKEKEAKKQLQVYISQIAAPEMLAKETQKIQEQGLEFPEPEVYNGPYQEAGQRAEEYKSGADTLLLVGILGMIALVLLHLDLIPISLSVFSKMLVTFVMGIMFLIFIAMGIASRKSYANLKEQVKEETNLKADLQSYLKEQINQEFFDADLIDDVPTEEILYFRRIEKMKELINEKDATLDGAFVDYIIEETYPEIFES